MGDRPPGSAWVQKPGWFWTCPHCGQSDEMPLNFLVSFLQDKERRVHHGAGLDQLDDSASTVITDPGASASEVSPPTSGTAGVHEAAAVETFPGSFPTGIPLLA